MIHDNVSSFLIRITTFILNHSLSVSFIYIYLLSETLQYGYIVSSYMCAHTRITPHHYYNLASICDCVITGYPYMN